jgi:hypothetical protein
VSPRLQEDAQRLSHLVEMRQRQEAHLEKLRPFASSEAGSKRLQQGERELSRLDTQIDRLRERIYEQGPESLERRKEVARAGVEAALDKPLSTEDAALLGFPAGTTYREVREQATGGAPVPLKGEASKAFHLGNRMNLGHGTVSQLEGRGVTGTPFLNNVERAAGQLVGTVGTVVGLAAGRNLPATGAGAATGYGIGDLAGGLVNVARTPAERQYLTAQLAFIAGILRKESGAAITAEEYRQYSKIYFPQVGDDAETIAYKRDLRQAEIDSLQDQFPNRPFRAAPELPPARKASEPPPPARSGLGSQGHPSEPTPVMPRAFERGRSSREGAPREFDVLP